MRRRDTVAADLRVSSEPGLPRRSGHAGHHGSCGPRVQIAGVEVITAALRERADVRLVLVRADDASEGTAQLVRQAEACGARIWRGSPGDMRRMGRGPDAEIAVALLGPPPTASVPELLGRGGISWLLHRAKYPSNVGYAVRTAEVSGADGVIVDARFNHADRARIDHVSMGASRLMPVLFHDTESVLEQAAQSGVRCICLEDVGARAPWEVDMRGPLLCLIGSEHDGFSQQLVARCAAVVRIPMAGFVPSYNIQAAMAAIAVERLRQLSSEITEP
jgi:23S rRNA (guanosine2251-2'-O)-methyltransferase